jgi:hypothetical protein
MNALARFDEQKMFNRINEIHFSPNLTSKERENHLCMIAGSGFRNLSLASENSYHANELSLPVLGVKQYAGRRNGYKSIPLIGLRSTSNSLIVIEALETTDTEYMRLHSAFQRWNGATV